MKTKFILIVCFLIVGFNVEINAQTPVPEDYFDLYDNEPSDDDDGNTEELKIDDIKIYELKGLFDRLGALGAFPSRVILDGIIASRGCNDETYTCMLNTLLKVLKIAEYEHYLKSDELSCNVRKVLLQDYAMYLITLNLDIYCIDHLHPDSNELSDVQLINVMLAISDFLEAKTEGSVDDMKGWPMLFPYRKIREVADPFCVEELKSTTTCDCGEYNGTLDTTEKNKLLMDIRTIIDDINPMWQTAKAIEINQKLKALPCQD